MCSIAHVTVTWGCALQVTVSTYDSCCCPLQLFRVVAHWVAMRSWSLVRLNTSLERSVEPPLASMCSLDKEKFFRGLITPKLQLQEKQHAHLLGDLPPARSWSLALRARWSPRTDAHRYLFLFWLLIVPAVSSERRLTLLVSCPSGACLSDEPPGSCCHCSAVSLECRAAICIHVGVSPDWCSPATLLPLFTRKVNCSRNLKKVTANNSSTFCMLQGSTDSVCGLSTCSALVSHVHLRPHGGPRVNQSRSAAPGNACGR